MGDAALPPKADITPADVVFTEATPSQRRLTWRLNGVSWAPPMSIPVYEAREQALSETALCRDGGCTYWILHRRGSPEDIVSSCEAALKTALVRDEGAAGSVQKVVGYSIASVYTNPVYREKGMATLMLKNVQEVMDTKSGCSALYSDIGKVFYAKLGWEVYPSLQVALALHDAKVSTPGGLRFLKRDEIKAHCDKDVGALMKKFEQLEGDEKTHIAFTPSWEQMDWHFTRDGFMAKALLDREIEHRGVTTEDGASWLYFDHDFRENKLKVLRIVADDAAAVAKLLTAALAEAGEWGLAKVLVWNPDEKVSEAAKGIGKETGVEVVFDERLDGSIPSLRWKGGEEKQTIWENNEYYSWC